MEWSVICLTQLSLLFPFLKSETPGFEWQGFCKTEILFDLVVFDSKQGLSVTVCNGERWEVGLVASTARAGASIQVCQETLCWQHDGNSCK